MKKTVTLFILLFIVIGSIILYSKDNIKTVVLKPVRVVPDENEYRVYFDFIPFIAVSEDGYIYISNSRRSKIFMVDFHGRYIRDISRKGVGPGDIYLPMKIYYIKNKLIVFDNNGFSIFDKKGNFINKFRNFGFTLEYTADEKQIYVFYPYNKRIISVFNYKGNKLFSFGKKFGLNQMIYKNKKLPAFTIYNGQLAVGDGFIYLVYSLTGDIYKYDMYGKLVLKKVMDFKNKNIIENLKYFRNLVFEKGYDGKKEHYNAVIESIFYYKKKLYVLINYNFLIKNKKIKENSPGIIMRFNSNTMELEEKYLFYNIINKNKTMNYGNQFVVREIKKSTYFFVPIASEGREYFYIGVYKTK
jgi:hypothetical protein